MDTFNSQARGLNYLAAKSISCLTVTKACRRHRADRLKPTVPKQVGGGTPDPAPDPAPDPGVPESVGGPVETDPGPVPPPLAL
jgi:hypothetical protein